MSNDQVWSPGFSRLGAAKDHLWPNLLGYWTLVVNWSLVIGHWSLVIHPRSFFATRLFIRHAAPFRSAGRPPASATACRADDDFRSLDQSIEIVSGNDAACFKSLR